MSNLLVTENGSLTYQTDPVITAATITINPLTSVFSNTVKCKGNRIFKKIGFTITGLTTSAGFAQSVSVAGVLTGTTLKVKGDGDSLVLDKDKEGPLTVDGFIGQSPSTYSITVIIDDEGQDKVKAK